MSFFRPRIVFGRVVTFTRFWGLAIGVSIPIILFLEKSIEFPISFAWIIIPLSIVIAVFTAPTIEEYKRNHDIPK